MPDPQLHLSCAIRHRVGALAIDVAFDLTQPWTVLFGPSGSGKSTILRVIAGLTRSDYANILIYPDGKQDGNIQVVADSSRGIMLPPHRRQVRSAAQRPALFPHMTVRENLRYAAEFGHDVLVMAAESALKRFRLMKIADDKPATLSGGEQQRVSLARAALAANGRLLLLDEPFTGLDASLRDDLLGDLKSWLALSKTPVLSVTHDIAEAFQLEAEVIKLREGRILQQGPAADVLEEERARLLGLLR